MLSLDYIKPYFIEFNHIVAGTAPRFDIVFCDSLNFIDVYMANIINTTNKSVKNFIKKILFYYYNYKNEEKNMYITICKKSQNQNKKNRNIETDFKNIQINSMNKRIKNNSIVQLHNYKMLCLPENQNKQFYNFNICFNKLLKMQLQKQRKGRKNYYEKEFNKHWLWQNIPWMSFA